jgi:hypothetical protein
MYRVLSHLLRVGGSGVCVVVGGRLEGSRGRGWATPAPAGPKDLQAPSILSLGDEVAV